MFLSPVTAGLYSIYVSGFGVFLSGRGSNDFSLVAGKLSLYIYIFIYIYIYIYMSRFLIALLETQIMLRFVGGVKEMEAASLYIIQAYST
jgi:hypothetical protein